MVENNLLRGPPLRITNHPPSVDEARIASYANLTDIQSLPEHRMMAVAFRYLGHFEGVPATIPETSSYRRFMLGELPESEIHHLVLVSFVILCLDHG